MTEGVIMPLCHP